VAFAGSVRTLLAELFQGCDEPFCIRHATTGAWPGLAEVVQGGMRVEQCLAGTVVAGEEEGDVVAAARMRADSITERDWRVDVPARVAAARRGGRSALQEGASAPNQTFCTPGMRGTGAFVSGRPMAGGVACWSAAPDVTREGAAG